MNTNIQMIDQNHELVNANLIFSFHCYKKDYVVLDYSFSLFQDNSKYNNLNIFEVSSIENQKIFVSDIPENDWKKIKDFLVQEIFNHI